jgi:hypothetical protein
MTPSDVYSSRILNNASPAGYKIMEFRPPKRGELFITDSGFVNTLEIPDYGKECPRFILKKTAEIILGCEETSISVKEVYGKDMEIPEGYKYVGFRPPKLEEHYLTLHGVINTAPNSVAYTNMPRIIVTKA